MNSKDLADYLESHVTPTVAIAHDRFHFVVSTNPDVFFLCNGHPKHLEAGKVWWIDNKSPHSVHNHGSSDRIHIVVDIKKE
jgi:aspartyl/asparaginyl beta-hydroxylase (cupin superfamily)